MLTHNSRPSSRRRLHGTKSAIWALLALLVFGATPSHAESLASVVKREIQARNLCATIEFDGLKVDVKSGVTRRSAGFGEKVRKGDPLIVKEVDVSHDGLELEIELMSEDRSGDTIGVDVRFERSIRGEKHELVNEEDLWKAVG